LQMWPADVPTAPNASTNNWTSGSAPLPNQIDVKLSPAGQINVRNDAGTVNVLIDIVGYYEPATSSGATGPQGPVGPAGPAGSSVGGIFYGDASDTSDVPANGSPVVVGDASVHFPSAGFVQVTAVVSLTNSGAASADVSCFIDGSAFTSSPSISASIAAGKIGSLTVTSGMAVTAIPTFIMNLKCATSTGNALIRENFTMTGVFSPTRII
jgi:hypothetical protein